MEILIVLEISSMKSLIIFLNSLKIDLLNKNGDKWNRIILEIIKEGEEKEHTEVLKSAVQRLNEQLKLNVSLGIDVQYGNNYVPLRTLK